MDALASISCETPSALMNEKRITLRLLYSPLRRRSGYLVVSGLANASRWNGVQGCPLPRSFLLTQKWYNELRNFYLLLFPKECIILELDFSLIMFYKKI